MKRNSQKTTQVNVCRFCGDKGFSNALIDCSKCPNTFAHQYCVGIPPGTIDRCFTWVCDDCCEPAQHEPSISTKSSEETCNVSIDVTTNSKMKAFTSLYSKSCILSGKRNEQKRKKDSLDPNNEILSTSRSQHRVKRLKDQSYLSTNEDDIEVITTSISAKDNWDIVLYNEPLLTLTPIEYDGSSEQEETSYGPVRTEPKFMSHLLRCDNEHWDSISSVMDRPKEITRGVVLLVSPLGEIYIECTSDREEFVHKIGEVPKLMVC